MFSVLARNGRQTLAAIIKASYLNSRQIKLGLVVLIQQHLIFHSDILERGATCYEIDWQQSYASVRSGKIVQAVEERFGKKPANVISNLITVGHTRIGDLRNAYFPPADVESDDGTDDRRVNGVSTGKSKANGDKVNGTSSVAKGSSSSTLEELDDLKPVLDAAVNGKLHANGLTNGNTNASKVSNVNGRSKVSREEPAEEVDEETIGSITELDAIIHHLMVHGWIIKVEDTQYLSPGDLHGMAQHDMIIAENKGQNPTGKKEQDRLATATLQRKRVIRDGWSTIPDSQSRKRKASNIDSDRSSKRMKVGSGTEWLAPGVEDVSLDDHLIVRLNPEKVAVSIRTHQLVHLVERRRGFVPAKIYETMLLILEKNMGRCFEEWPDPAPIVETREMDREIDGDFLVTARDVARKIDPTVDVCDGLDSHTIIFLTESHGTHSVDKHNRIQPSIDPFTLTLDIKTKIVAKHITALSDDPFHFVTWVARSGGSQWHVEFKEISKALIQTEIENTVAASSERDSKFSVKLIRALKTKGKLDERQMSNAMMMPAAEVRSVVNALALRGFVQTQEIPRVERREAKHSIHLIGYDCQRAREKLLHDTYKGMVRILQRLASEKEKVHDLLSKAERTDVVGNEQKWLTAGELAALKRWREIEGKLLVQLWREDDLVAILRDFIGPLVSA